MGIKLLDFDLFGSTIGFKVDNHNIKRSYLGLCFSASFLCLISFFLVYYGKKFLNLEIIYQNTSDFRFITAQNILLNDSFVFGLSTSLDNISSDRIMNITVKHFEIVNNQVSSEIPVDLVDCNSYNWSNSSSTSDKLIDTDNLTCYNVTNLRLRGNYMSNNYTYIDIKYYLKLTGSDEEDDANAQYLIETEPVVTLNMIDTVYRYNSTFMGGRKYISYRQLNIVPKTTTIARLFVNVNQAYFFYNSLLGKNFEVQYDFSINDSRYSFVTFRKDKPFLANFRLFSSSTTIQYSFTPKTFTEYVSELGGFLNISMLFFYSIINYFNHFHLNYMLVRKQLDLINSNHNDELTKFNKIKMKSLENKSNSYKKNRYRKDINNYEFNEPKDYRDESFHESSSKLVIDRHNLINTSLIKNTLLFNNEELKVENNKHFYPKKVFKDDMMLKNNSNINNISINNDYNATNIEAIKDIIKYNYNNSLGQNKLSLIPPEKLLLNHNLLENQRRSLELSSKQILDVNERMMDSMNRPHGIIPANSNSAKEYLNSKFVDGFHKYDVSEHKSSLVKNELSKFSKFDDSVKVNIKNIISKLYVDEILKDSSNYKASKKLGKSN